MGVSTRRALSDETSVVACPIAQRGAGGWGFNEFDEKSTSRVEVRSVCAEARFFVFVLFLQSCGVRLRLFGTGPRRAVVWPDAPVRPVGTVAVPTLRYDPSGRSPSRRSGTTRRDGSRPDAPVRPVGTFAVPTPRWVTSSRRLTTLQIKPVRLASQPLSVAYVPRAVSALRDSGRSGAAAAAVVQDGRILGIARVFRLE